MSEVLPVDLAIGIRAETSLADPDRCKFAVSRTAHPGGPFFFDSKEHAAGSPLVDVLLRADGLRTDLDIKEAVGAVGISVAPIDRRPKYFPSERVSLRHRTVTVRNGTGHAKH